MPRLLKKFTIVLSICVLSQVNPAYAEKDEQVAETSLFAMDTYMTLRAYGEYGERAVEAAADLINDLDALLSTGNTESEIFSLNDLGEGTLSVDTASLIEAALTLYDETEGVFNIAVYPAMEAWGFTDQAYRVPSDAELEELKPLTDVSSINYDEENRTVAFSVPGMKIDLGGIAKGYTSLKIMELYRELGVTSGLVSLGGNVQVLGCRPDGKPWRIAVQDPVNPEEYLGVLAICDTAVITSGAYERYFEQDGNLYHHILDPETLCPSDSGLLSATIVSPNGTLADALSTSVFIMGLDRALEFWQESEESFEMILQADDGIIYITEGLDEKFTSEAETVILRKDENE